MGRKLIDLTGKVFGRLTVARREEGRSAVSTWACRCECGKEKVVAGQALRRGETRSCGCLRADPAAWDGRSHAWRDDLAELPTLTVAGHAMTVDEAATVAMVDRTVILARLARGLSGDDAVFLGDRNLPF